MRAFLSGKKLYIIAVASLIVMLYNAWMAADFDPVMMWTLLDWPHVTEAVGAIALRAGIAKGAG